MTGEKSGTYSLLEEHNDLVSYRIPDPIRDSPAWVRIGLFPWEMEGVHVGQAFAAEFLNADIDLETAAKRADGIGLRTTFYGPTSHHPSPMGYEDRVSEVFDIFSGKPGQFRIKDARPDGLRQMGRWIALYAFAYWDWLEHQTDYPIGKRGTRSEMLQPAPETVSEDGTVVSANGSYQTPYSLEDMELLAPDEWTSPQERAVDQIETAVDELGEGVQKRAISDALRKVADQVHQPLEETEAKKRRQSIVDALWEGSEIGHIKRNRIANEFETVADLCDDLRRGGDRLRSLSGINEGTEENVIDALIESGAWEGNQEPQQENEHNHH